LVVNRVKSNMALVAVKSPGFGALRVDHLEDVCTLTGAKLVSSSTGVPVSQAVAALGRVKKLVVDARSTLLVGTGNTQEAVTARVMTLTERATDPTLAHEELEDIRIRVAKLSKGVAIVRVGGATEMEMIERRYRIEDALNATRAAAEEGIVPGGGTALFDAFWELTREGLAPTPGTNAALRGCLAPLKRIVANSAKVSPEVIVNKLSELRSNGDLNGYNAASDKFEDLVSSGIIDPVKVTASAFKHATSVAVAFLSLDAVICDEDAS
jgi:chaperonin GroEL